MKTKKKRNRIQTQQRVMMAVQSVIAQHGLERVTISLVAEQAQVTKVLIYRYFGTLDQLLETYVQQGPVFAQFAHQHAQLSFQGDDPATNWTSQTTQLFRLLRASKAAREMLKASLTDTDSLARLMAQSQDTQLQKFAHHLSGLDNLAGNDPQALLSIVLGGLSYLTILAHLDRPMLDIDLRSETGWSRVESALKVLYRALDTSPNHRMMRSSERLALSEW